MTFRQVYFDQQVLNEQRSISFFTESEEDQASVTSMSEDQAIRWLLQSRPIRELFAEEFFHGSNGMQAFFGLGEPFTVTNKKPGDIDLLLVDPSGPNRAIAFECKRVKVTSLDATFSKVNNAEGIRKGVIQANAYQSLGFHQTYLMVILLDDSRRLSSYPNTMLRRSGSNNVEEVYDIAYNEKPHDDVGIVYLKVTQPTGKHYDQMCGVGLCVDKQAGRLEQTPEMTNKVRNLLSQKVQ